MVGDREFDLGRHGRYHNRFLSIVKQHLTIKTGFSGRNVIATPACFAGGSNLLESEGGCFIPRNVQTADGRKTTVFAIRLQVEDPGDSLKAGMPADVVFK